MNKIVLFLAIFVNLVFANIGHISALKGKVSIDREGKIITEIKKGYSLKEKDIIFTKNRSKVQIKFKDNTIITIGKNSTFEIQEYLFDSSKKSKATFKVKRGFFKAVTGKIGKIARKRFKLKTKTATCGIRGTHFTGLIKNDKEFIACTKGAITVTAQDKTINVNQGEMTIFKSGFSPEPARKFYQSDLKNLNNSFSLNSKLIKKIEKVKLKKDGKIDNETIKEVLTEIYQIVDSIK